MSDGAARTPRPIGERADGWSVLRLWRDNLRRDLDYVTVIDRVRGDSGWSARYAFMICMSAGIAILGLLLSSPAVVIGAMLLSPLMGPILGAGFALAIGDFQWLRQSSRALLAGSVLAILFCAFIVLVSPLNTVTEEIAARTRPNLFDLAVALFSALAGSYAMIRGREGTIVGVAIATALMPPLAVVGFGLATRNWTVFGGSLLLFFTNLMTIALTAAVMARLYGFRTRLSDTQTWLQSFVVIGVFLLLAVPLGFSLQQIAWEANAQGQAKSIVSAQFGSVARVNQIDFDFDSDPINLTASVLTPEYVGDAEQRTQRLLQRQLNREFSVTINQYRVGTGAGDAESAELATARAKEQAIAAEQEVTLMADRVALVAGVGSEDVVVDRNTKRALVKAKPLPGAGLATYRALEQRVTSLEPEWTVQVRPPASELPSIAFADGEPSGSGETSLALAIWAAQRIDAPIGVGGKAALADTVVARLRAAGVTAVAKRDQQAVSGTVSLDWLAPDEVDPAPEG